MANESSAVVGSGVSVLREQQNVRSMRGNNSIVVNYEDINSCIGVIRSSSVSVGTTPIQVTPPDNRMSGRRKLMIQNLGPTDFLFIGGEDVSSTNGFTLRPYAVGIDGFLEFDVLDYGNIWMVSAGTSDVRIIEMR